MAHIIKQLSEELQKIAYEELGETPEIISQDLQTLKSWIEQQPYLRVRTDDQFLVQFLRGCKYDLEAAKKKVDYFFAFKTFFPNTIEVDSPKFREIYNLG